MANTVEEAVVRKSVRVQAPIERAFSVFVEQMEDVVAGRRITSAKLRFEAIFVEPRVGGRWYERNAAGEAVRLGHSAGVGSAATGAPSRGILVRDTIRRTGSSIRTWPGPVKWRFALRLKDREPRWSNWNTAGWSATARATSSCAIVRRTGRLDGHILECSRR